MYTIQLLLHVVVCYCVRCVHVTDFFTIRVESFVPGHVSLSRLCAGPYIPVASRNTDLCIFLTTQCPTKMEGWRCFVCPVLPEH